MAEKQFPCKQCGAKVEFDPGAATLKCPYCNFENPIPQSEEDIEELDFKAFLAKAASGEETVESQTVKCETCAAEVSLDPGVAASECPFCGSNIVKTGGSTKAIKPKSLLPFKVTQKEGREAFRKWIKSLWFAPGKLKQYARSDSKLSGIYVPYWTYDSDTTSYYTGQRGEHYWVTETYTTMEDGKSVTKTRQVRRTRWYPASGVVWNRFDDILVLASKSLPTKYAEALDPWDLENLVEYNDDYLSGFRAESYQVDLAEGFEQAKEVMDDGIRVSVRADIGGDEQRIHSIKTKYEDITFKHILLPIWISAYRFKQKVYRFLVNARTAEVQGERPWSIIKIAMAVLAAAGVIGGAVYLIMQYAG
jgi:DNA-directed RNA polymerase subunit RPC12/RpoP/preprotein translocase subunit Sss1